MIQNQNKMNKKTKKVIIKIIKIKIKNQIIIQAQIQILIK